MFSRLADWGGLGAAALRARMSGDWRGFARKLAEFYGRKGKMLRLDVDSAEKSIAVEVQLKGQPAPWRVNARGYSFRSDADGEKLRFDSVEASEEWLTTILRFAGVAEKGVQIPAEYAELIKLAL